MHALFSSPLTFFRSLLTLLLFYCVPSRLSLGAGADGAGFVDARRDADVAGGVYRRLVRQAGLHVSVGRSE